ncbi:cell division protein FtsQ/DivIB [Croceicoccus naphthovorans]|uniref:Cell division protein FtsQ n=1 Tax=Croceicoccus naphthovorans TaxID=1348774 RepID=A0A0G3XGU4_9SPHN|nr:FtsQ-type POTRA domain-containing protein [Croceicoccus naphthovorans]AKM10755.1 cell division protein FtsQ [Croceicoccus naphthovorans]MBB3988945.1 cell division protein FtsQ [Croceicoccus naphthovorans]
MSSTTIKRGGKGVRRAAASKGKKRAVADARARTGGLLNGLVGALGLSEKALQRLFTAVIALVVITAAGALAVVSGLPGFADEKIGNFARDAGFAVKQVEVHGVKRMDSQEIYRRAIAAQTQPMTRLDVAALREELVALPWVRDARVSRQLPDKLVIDVIERTPHAVLQQGENFVLIDPAGHQLEPVAPAKAQKMLVLKGDGAAERAGDLALLLDSAPALKKQVRGAEWIGHRRWNITFATGQVVALPEGEAEASEALVAFAQMDGMNRLLGGSVAVFDMRDPSKVYMRVPGRAAEEAEARAEAKRLAAKAETQAGGD